MTSANANGATRGDDDGVVAASVMAKWLRLAAAPTFTIMALSTVILDSGAPSTLCTAPGSLSLNGMAPMYLLMALFHLAPWLKLMSRLGPVATLFVRVDRPSCT